MSDADRARWNTRHEGAEPDVVVPSGFVDVVDLIPRKGTALDVACGVGGGALWLARRGLDVLAVDGSDVAISVARRAASRLWLEERCRFELHDLDLGLPSGPPVDLITCHLFSAPGLDSELFDRLRPGGVLAITVLSEVGGDTGPFRVHPGELLDRLTGLDVRHHREGEGIATAVAVATGPAGPNAA